MFVNAMVFPSLSHLIDVQLAHSPDQEKFFRRRFESADGTELDFLEELAGHIRQLEPASEKKLSEDYAWLCAEQIKEELHFRRQKNIAWPISSKLSRKSIATRST